MVFNVFQKVKLFNNLLLTLLFNFLHRYHCNLLPIKEKQIVCLSSQNLIYALRFWQLLSKNVVQEHLSVGCHICVAQGH